MEDWSFFKFITYHMYSKSFFPRPLNKKTRKSIDLWYIFMLQIPFNFNGLHGLIITTCAAWLYKTWQTCKNVSLSVSFSTDEEKMSIWRLFHFGKKVLEFTLQFYFNTQKNRSRGKKTIKSCSSSKWSWMVKHPLKRLERNKNRNFGRLQVEWLTEKEKWMKSLDI